MPIALQLYLQVILIPQDFALFCAKDVEIHTEKYFLIFQGFQDLV